MFEKQLSDSSMGFRFTTAITVAPHVHICVTGDGSVLLDLKHDRYLGLGKESTELIANVIAVWPRPRWQCSTERIGSKAAVAETEDLLKTLVLDGLLVPDSYVGAHRTFAPSNYMKRDWISMGDELEVDIAVTKTHVANFIAAFLWARMSLALRPFWVTVEKVREQKARHQRELETAHMAKVAGLVGVFRQLRPFVFAAEGHCLLHALTLVKFLGRYEFYPEWVTGVATRQWGAHSWVQWGDVLLDTNPDKVCRFTPIMVV